MWSESKVLLPPTLMGELFPKNRNVVRAPVFRNMTAKLNEAAGYPLPNTFFNYGSTGRPLQGRPPVRFGAFSTGLAVQGVGPQGAEMVDSMAHHVRRIWSTHVGAPLVEHRYSGRNALRWAARPAEYLIHQLAFDLPKGWWIDQPQAKLTLLPHLAALIKRGLTAEVDDIHRNDMSIHGSDVLNEIDDMMIDIVSIDGVGLTKVNPGTTNRAVLPYAYGVRFKLTIDIDGIWHVGRLSARGFGKIRRVLACGSLCEHAGTPFRSE